WGGTLLRGGQLGRLLHAVVDAWTSDRDEVLAAGQRIAKALTEATAVERGRRVPDAELLDAAAARLGGQFDPAHGGFGRAPKFPPSMVLEFLLRHYERTGSPSSLEIVARTGPAMARGRMDAHLPGGVT